MKNLLERLRLWLIKKLDGYTRQQVLTYRYPPLQWMRPEIQKVQAIARFPWEKVAGWNQKDLWKQLEMELAEELARQLIMGQFVVIQTTEDKPRNEVVIRAAMMAVRGKDVAINEEWGPTPESDDWRHLRPL